MSVWADIHRRANGHQERKEDKIFKEDNKFNEPDLLGDWDWSRDWEKELKRDYSRFSNPWKYREMLDIDMWK